MRIIYFKTTMLHNYERSRRKGNNSPLMTPSNNRSGQNKARKTQALFQTDNGIRFQCFLYLFN